jgi:osmotically-inducible protein OsmY
VGESVLEKVLRRKLGQDPVAERHDFRMVVRNAKAYLYGVVDNKYEKKRVELLAESVPGMVSAANNIAARSDDLPWEHLDDVLIRNTIEKEYRYEFLIDPGDLKISVKDDVVTVSGSIESAAELQAIVRHALDSGAKMVITRLLFNGMKKYGAYTYRDRYAFNPD